MVVIFVFVFFWVIINGEYVVVVIFKVFRCIGGWVNIVNY